jgi:tetratricopeptide (TPR) repeat protein
MRRLVIAAIVLAISNSGDLARADPPTDCTQLKNLELTVSSCTEFINLGQANDHDRAVAYFNRGTAFGMTGKIGRAIDDLNHAIEADPSWPPPYNNRARAFVGNGEPERAIPDYNKALELNPRDAMLHVNRALAYLKLGDRDHALSDLQKGVELNPQDVFAVFNIGAIYEAKGDKERAAAEYRKALVLAPGNQNILDSLKRIGAQP